MRAVVLVLTIAVAAAVALYGRGVGLSTSSSSSPQPIAGGNFEASGVVYVPRSEGVLFVDDKNGQVVYWMELTGEGIQRGPAAPIPLGVDVVDPEGLTTDGTHIFIVGSQSKGDESGVGLARFRFDPRERRVHDVQPVAGLKRFLGEHVRDLREHADALNIEALAWDPRSRRLLLGLREPVIQGQAIVVPLALSNANGPFALENLNVPGGRGIPVSLGGAGFRSLEYDDTTRAFQAIADPESGSGDFRLVEWKGDDGSQVRVLATFPRALKAEGVTRVVIGGRPRTLIVFDAGRFSLQD